MSPRGQRRWVRELRQLLMASERHRVPGDQAAPGDSPEPVPAGHPVRLSICPGLVLEVRWRRREEGALPLAPAVQQGDALLLAVQGRATVARQGQVGGDALPEAVAEEGLVHAQWVPRAFGVLLQPVRVSKGDTGRGKREGEDKRMRRGRKKSTVSISPAYLSNSASCICGCVALDKSLNLSELPLASMAKTSL